MLHLKIGLEEDVVQGAAVVEGAPMDAVELSTL